MQHFGQHDDADQEIDAYVVFHLARVDVQLFCVLFQLLAAG